MIALVADLFYALGLILLLPVLLWKMLWYGKYRGNWCARMGGVSRRPGAGRCILVHGVSVGEIIAAKPLVERLEKQFPDWEIALSCTTDTGTQVAEKHYSRFFRARYPLDFSFATRRFLDAVRPDLVVLMELELWPNFLRVCEARGIPVVVANGRISERSHRGYKRWLWLLRGTLRRVALYCVQNEEYEARLRDLGVEPAAITVTGNLKFDAAPDTLNPIDVADQRKKLGLRKLSFVIVAGSTHAPEEKILLDAYKSMLADEALSEGRDFRLVLVPRHPERWAEVEREIQRAGFIPVRKTGLDKNPAGPAPSANTVVLGDTMGELIKWYTAADVVFVGGSLIPHGGQNMMEPAALGCAVLFGPHVFNFPDAVKLLLERNAAIQVQNADALAEKMKLIVADQDLRATLATNARAAILSQKGAAEKTVKAIGQLKQ